MSFLLQETGDKLQLETSDYLLIDTDVIDVTTTNSLTRGVKIIG